MQLQSEGLEVGRANQNGKRYKELDGAFEAHRPLQASYSNERSFQAGASSGKPRQCLGTMSEVVDGSKMERVPYGLVARARVLSLTVTAIRWHSKHSDPAMRVHSCHAWPEFLDVRC